MMCCWSQLGTKCMQYFNKAAVNWALKKAKCLDHESVFCSLGFVFQVGN